MWAAFSRVTTWIMLSLMMYVSPWLASAMFKADRALTVVPGVTVVGADDSMPASCMVAFSRMIGWPIAVEIDLRTSASGAAVLSISIGFRRAAMTAFSFGSI